MTGPSLDGETNVGPIWLGTHSVPLRIGVPSGGRCGPSHIYVGIEGDEDDVLATLIHETLEYSMHLRGCRSEPTNHFNPGHDGYLFHFDRRMFSELCYYAAVAVNQHWPKILFARKRLRRDARLIKANPQTPEGGG